MTNIRSYLFAILCMFATSAFAVGIGNDNPPGGGGTQLQGQAQGQIQGQAQGLINANQIEVSNRIGNDVRNKATSFAGAQSSSNSGGNTFTVNEAAIPADTTVTYGGKYEVKGVPNVFSGNVYPTAPCMGSSTIGGAGVGFGLSIGTSWTDDECGVRETARSFAGMGLKDDALAILCTSKYAAAAPSCPKPVAPEAK